MSTEAVWNLLRSSFVGFSFIKLSGELNDIAAVNSLFTALSLALCCNFLVVTFMCLKRIDMCYQVASRFWGRKK